MNDNEYVCGYGDTAKTAYCNAVAYAKERQQLNERELNNIDIARMFLHGM